ncbi:hypothetical protein PMZ80_007882 [Knufia obscura]|uniref:Alcohol dehydrogenase-like N-terminal domain-containing protein n=2 Tax=Knufia TaxID=430999 RepID=A0AAN8ELH5_9EURO|nr:hypothetical protein PMZ80_007882 [Knufia obscura]KAK5949471.1 hypothetical protein OHC33_009463 [Knufia fluminis]
MATHKALVLPQLSQPLQLKSLPLPPAVHGSAIVKVLSTPISPNAKAVFGGNFPVPLRTPVTPSACCIGRIHAVGPDATALKPGQLVLVDFWNQSRDDPHESILQGYMGGNATFESVWDSGTFAEHAQVPLERVWALNEEVLMGEGGLGYTFRELAYLGEVCIALAGLLDIDVRAGDTVVVAPATGFFGGSAVPAALALGARVIACGRNGGTLGKMEETFGGSGRFSTVVMSGDVEKDTAAIRAKCQNSKGADALIDFSPPQSGGSKHLVSCLSALRPYGSAALMGAVFSGVEVPYITVMRNNLRIQGRYMYDRWHGEQAVKLLEIGALKLRSGECGIRVQGFGLEDVQEAVDVAAKDNGWGNMIVLQPNVE